MKNLTRLFLIFFVTMFYCQANAQTFGIKGGLNLANMLDKDDDDKYSNDWNIHPGFNLGLTIDAPFNEYLSFEPGLLLTTKGTKFENRGLGFEIKAKVNLYYLDVPLTIKATHDLGNGLKMYGAVGPYFGLGLSGKINATLEYQGDKETVEEDVKWGIDEDEDYFMRSDMGLTFGAGVEIKSILIGISYDLGLSNISVNQDNGYTVKNRVLKYSIGYRF